MTCASSYCLPLAGVRFQPIFRAIEGVREVDTEIVWNTVWTPERMTASAREKLTLPMAQLLPLRQRRLEREAQASQSPIS